MSRRAGNFVSSDELIDDIGADATRLLSLMSSLDQATVLDLDLVRSKSMENPVYYVQYAHARIASIDRVRAERGIERLPLRSVDVSLLVHDRELELLRRLEELPDVVLDAGRDRRPAQGHRVGAGAGRRLSRLLPRLPRPGRQRLDPSSPRGGCGSWRRRASASPSGSTSWACTHPTRCSRDRRATGAPRMGTIDHTGSLSSWTALSTLPRRHLLAISPSGTVRRPPRARCSRHSFP